MRLLWHGFGPRTLPIPPEYAIAGACAALAVSFTVLALAWRTPRFNVDPRPQRPRERVLERVVDSVWFAAAVRLLGLAFAGFLAYAAVFGKDSLVNPFIGGVYCLLWVGIVPLSLLFGPFYKAVSPVRTLNLVLARLSGSNPEIGLRDYPRRLGYWPAALGLLAFVWMELVYQFGTELGPLRLWCATYVAIMLVGGAVFGNSFYEHADPFEVFSTLVGHLSPWSRVDGRFVLRSPLSNLDLVPVRPGLLAVCAVLLGSTAFDSFETSSFWISRVQSVDFSLTWLDFFGLLGLVLVVGVLFTAATMATGVEDGHHHRTLPIQFAHSLVPIVVGYMVAHYLAFYVEYGQTTILQMNDPLTDGSDLFGLSGRQELFLISSNPVTGWWIQVLGVVGGHVTAVIAAHDRAVKLLPRRHQLTGQLPVLFVMVGFTVGGLFLLFGA